MKFNKYCKTPILLIMLLWISIIVLCKAYAQTDSEKFYVGCQKCQSCHEEEFNSFQQYSKKANSFSSVTIMKKGLTPNELTGCYACHTTGYGESGGFVSEEKTPHLKNAGCEVCHGPGSIHVKTESTKDIKGTLSVHDCERCHNSEKVDAFRYKPLIHGGAH